MHRRISLLALILTLLLVSLPTARAQPFPAAVLYLPLVVQSPPLLTSLLLVPGEVSEDYKVTYASLPNAAAAQLYADPDAVLAAFAAQGREDSERVHFAAPKSTARLLQVAHQVIRFSTSEGASAGQDFIMGTHSVDLGPGCGSWRSWFLSGDYGGRLRAQRRTCTTNVDFEHQMIMLQRGQHVSIVELLGREPLDTFYAAYFTRLGANKLP